MDIDIYQTLTGITIKESQIPQFEASMNRAMILVQNALGYMFNYTPTFSEKGVSPRECDCPTDDSSLLPPEIISGEVKLFRYDVSDVQIRIDPASAIYAAKLIVPDKGDSERFVSVKKIEKWIPKYNEQGWTTYIEKCEGWPFSLCGCDCKNCVLLAVWGDWIDVIPVDLQYLICDMITFFMNNNPLERGIKSESVDGHSVSYDNSPTNPIDSPMYSSLIKKYMGPYSPYYKKVMIV